MRLSIDESDPGYLGRVVFGTRVFFNGYERRGVITADEEAGLVVVYERDREGRFVLTEDRQSLRRVTEFGLVRIEASPIVVEIARRRDELRRNPPKEVPALPGRWAER